MCSSNLKAKNTGSFIFLYFVNLSILLVSAESFYWILQLFFFPAGELGFTARSVQELLLDDQCSEIIPIILRDHMESLGRTWVRQMQEKCPSTVLFPQDPNYYYLLN